MYRLFLFVVTLFIAMPARAEKLKVVGTHFNKIFETDTSGDFHGVAVDLLKKVAAKKNLQIEYAIYPWNRAQYLISTGRADILIGPYRTPEREKQMDFLSTPFYTDNMVFYTTKDKPFVWNESLDLLKTKRILTIKGWVYGIKFDEIKDKLTIVEANDIETAFRMLALGRADLLLANERNAEDALEQKENKDHFIKTKKPFSFMQGYFAFSLKYKNDSVKKAIQESLSQLSYEGIIKKINKDYKLSFDPRVSLAPNH
nr:transporter substrate-binding domain-containing protein [Bacteriovorax sp. HI3]